MAAARNTAINNASGKYFSFCDDDDSWPPTLANDLVESIEQADNRYQLSIAIDPSFANKKIVSKYLDLNDFFMLGITPPVSSQIYRTSILKKVRGYNSDIKTGVDHDLWVRLLSYNPAVNISWCKTAFVDTNPSRQRMTTNENVRLKNIKNSLKIWKFEIEINLGIKFYDYFFNEYLQVLEYDFFRQSFLKKDLYGINKRLFKPNIMYRCFCSVLRKIFNIKRPNKFDIFKQ